MGEDDFLPLFGASLIAYLHSFVSEGKRVLVKIPDVQYLSYFYTVFPNEDILLLLRDGRDVVSSTMRTWPDKSFSNVCRQWDLSTKAMLEFRDKNKEIPSGFWMTRYEDVVRDPANFARIACEKFQLNQENFPFEKIKNISVRGSSSIKSEGKVTWNASEKPKGFNPVGRWQNWSKRRKKTFKDIAGETLIAAGYTDNQNW
jgi:protein-tyrosine sulfotransferase